MSGVAGGFQAAAAHASDRRRFALLIVAAWVAGLAIAATLAVAEPVARSSHHPGVTGGGMEERVAGEIAGRRWNAPAQGRIDPDGRRWTIVA